MPIAAERQDAWGSAAITHIGKSVKRAGSRAGSTSRRYRDSLESPAKAAHIP